MNNDSDELLRKYSEVASDSDEKKIRENLKGMNRGPIKKIWDDVQLLWQMVRDPGAPWKSKAMAIGALVYLVSPIDVIPDLVPLLGLTDDVGVIVAAVGALAADLKRYRKKR